MKVYNGVDHPVNIVVGAVPHPVKRKLYGGEIVRSYPQNKRLDAGISYIQVGTLEDGTPEYDRVIDSCDPLPDGDWDIIIVSPLYAQAYTAEHGDDPRLRLVCQPVMDGDMRSILGCVGLIPYMRG